ncbi:hypothetical protein ASV53_20585 [Photobacterium sanguinicancri]|uniref:Uncharacterized protein n=1 Tax=Photobacterium sanguinicancri TaxID=875932 RepID=A0ABX4FT68_9GAMM|nr:hypothetical protein ASV53_20585 [Photobacterium sanguinicancri]
MEFSGFGEFIVAHLILGVTCFVFNGFYFVGLQWFPSVVAMQKESFIVYAVLASRFPNFFGLNGIVMPKLWKPHY